MNSRGCRYNVPHLLCGNRRAAQLKASRINKRLRGLATELVQLKLDVIVLHGTPGTRAAKQATTTIPIVMAAVVDPVATGLVASLARRENSIATGDCAARMTLLL